MTAMAILMSGLVSSNAVADGATGQSDALMIVPLTVEQITILNFGGIVSGPAGTVTIPLDGTVSSTGGIQLMNPPTKTFGIFLVKGDPNRAFNYSTDSTVTLNGPGGASMAAFLLPSHAGSVILTSHTNLDASGEMLVGVAAELTVLANQVPGSYAGAYTIVVDY